MRSHKSRSIHGNASKDDFLDFEDVQDASQYEFAPEKERKGKPGIGFLPLLSKIIRRKRFILTVLMLSMVAVFLYFRHTGYLTPDNVLLYLRQYPTLAPIMFMLIYALMVTFLLPTLPLNLAAGFLWGSLFGCALSIAAATLGASWSFLLARYLGRDFLEERFTNRAWRRLRHEIDKQDWKAVAFTRINPVFPFGPLNYYFGLTSISFAKFVWTTALFILPPSLMFSMIGDSIGGIVLTGEAYSLVQNVLVISAVLTLLLALRVAMKRYFRNRKAF